ncbi:MAG: hypothetical protein KUL83_01765 [Lentimicrobium sp.]|jgi:hypothetical protein|nr:hypothetical protein [Lentimicrobium sp.]MDD2526705.1 hypothetical protein [Lentimicrobiaceae bacterium]MDD4596429.1 hypothetical protein [Lentimicrobiaceae bacterium]MDY0024671.1 hypothetical protein [Lentimicrobium sp.]HAH57317.1 DUF1858 domain-containing protein [Bacteroidales bacterium]
MKKPEITPGITIEELIDHFPEANAFLIKRGLPCIICGEPVWGTLAELARDKKFTEDEIAQLTADLKAHLSV